MCLLTKVLFCVVTTLTLFIGCGMSNLGTKLSDSRIFYQLANKYNGLITLDDSTKFSEFNILEGLEIFFFNANSGDSSIYSNQKIDAAVDLFENVVQQQ